MNWVKLTNVASDLEAELLVERFKSANVIAVSRGNDIVGLFGPGFQGRTARGVDILVASEQEAMARELLADFLDENDEATDELDSDPDH
ncbi:MAG TPA: hypothetical protein VN651_00940 [Gemmatimonadaceae bacterium]|nr:hypothetical protein [Gemmatimonadaceae bacterium]